MKLKMQKYGTRDAVALFFACLVLLFGLLLFSYYLVFYTCILLTGGPYSASSLQRVPACLWEPPPPPVAVVRNCPLAHAAAQTMSTGAKQCPFHGHLADVLLSFPFLLQSTQTLFSFFQRNINEFLFLFFLFRFTHLHLLDFSLLLHFISRVFCCISACHSLLLLLHI